MTTTKLPTTHWEDEEDAHIAAREFSKSMPVGIFVEQWRDGTFYLDIFGTTGNTSMYLCGYSQHELEEEDRLAEQEQRHPNHYDGN